MTWLGKLLRSKFVIWTLLVLPGLWPVWPIYIKEDFGVLADAPKYVLLHLGLMASVLLAVVLTFTPLRVLFPKWDVALALNRHRRLVGVSVFAYAAIHFGAHLYYEGGWPKLAHTLKTIVDKPFLLTGAIALTILLVLTVTSLHAAVRWLGGKLWKNLHRLIYPTAALVIYHQISARKTFPMQVVWIFGPVLLLEIARIWKARTRQNAHGSTSNV